MTCARIYSMLCILLVTNIYAMNDNLIPREILFSNPERARPMLSSNGEYITFLGNDETGILNIFIAPIDDLTKTKQLSKSKRNIVQYFWAYDNQHVLYLQDQEGDENHHLYAMNVSDLTVKDLTPFAQTKVLILAVDHKFPREIIIALNINGKEFHDPYKVNIESGKLELLEENKRFLSYIIDHDYNLRFATLMTQEGEYEIYKREGNEYQLYDKINYEDSAVTEIIGFDGTNQALYWSDSRDRNTSALIQQHIDNKERKSIIGHDERADIEDIIVHPTSYDIQAWSTNFIKSEWRFVDQQFAKYFFKLQQLAADHHCGRAIPKIVSRTLLDDKWIVSFLCDDHPTSFHLYDLKAQRLDLLFTSKPGLATYDLQPTEGLQIPTRDGLNLVSYITKPPAYYKPPYPAVLVVHGGPRYRDKWGIDSVDQWLANRGYVVLKVNYRGSTGFGKNFINAGNLQWAAKMHDDLIDATKYLVQEYAVDAKRIAIKGGSYGGYAALVGLTFTPEVFACGVDIVGPSNLLTLTSSVPPYWKPMLAFFKRMLGDFDTAEGKEILKSKSPLFKVQEIVKPLLIQHGTNDPRVKVAESEQIVTAMQQNNIPVIYMEFTDEGHGFLQENNKKAAMAAIESFLAKYLGGELEEPKSQDYTTDTLHISGSVQLLPEANFPEQMIKR